MMLRKILAIIAGVIAGIAVITLIQQLSSMMHPMPEGVSMNDMEAFKTWAASLPTSAYLMVILSYVLGSFVGGFVSTLVTRIKFWPAIVVGGILMLMGILNAVAIPQPLWVSIASILCFIPAAWLGARLVKTA